jgi:hypothetical protein
LLGVFQELNHICLKFVVVIFKFVYKSIPNGKAKWYFYLNWLIRFVKNHLIKLAKKKKKKKLHVVVLFLGAIVFIYFFCKEKYNPRKKIKKIKFK